MVVRRSLRLAVQHWTLKLVLLPEKKVKTPVGELPHLKRVVQVL
jgi:hypothetical protein